MKKGWVYSANIIVSFLAGACLISGQWAILIIVSVAAAILNRYFNKFKNNDEKEEIQDKFSWAFALGMFVPFVVLIIFLFYFLFEMISRHMLAA